MRPRTRLHGIWLASVFRLPVEIRIMIYHLVWQNAIFIDIELVQSKHIYNVGGRGIGLHPYGVSNDRYLFSLLQTCQFFRSEARPFLFEHLTVVLRGTNTLDQQPTTTSLLLKEVRVLTCSPYRALHLDLTTPSRLEVLVIVHKNHPQRGMSIEQARTLIKADLPKLEKFYTGKQTHANQFPHAASRIASPISSILVGLQSVSPGYESEIAKEAGVHALSKIFTEMSSVVPSGHTLGLLIKSMGDVEVHSLHGNETGHSEHYGLFYGLEI